MTNKSVIKKIAAAALALTLACGAVAPTSFVQNSVFDSAVAASAEGDTSTSSSFPSDLIRVADTLDDGSTPCYVFYKIDGDTLHLVGAGKMPNYNSTNRPAWERASGWDNVTNVVIEAGVTNIPDYAFYNKSSISSVKIASTVISIGECAFQNCTSLRGYGEKLIIPAGVETISNSAFYACNINNVYIPSTVKKVEANAFSHATKSAGTTIDVYASTNNCQWSFAAFDNWHTLNFHGASGANDKILLDDDSQVNLNSTNMKEFRLGDNTYRNYYTVSATNYINAASATIGDNNSIGMTLYIHQGDNGTLTLNYTDPNTKEPDAIELSNGATDTGNHGAKVTSNGNGEWKVEIPAYPRNMDAELNLYLTGGTDTKLGYGQYSATLFDSTHVLPYRINDYLDSVIGTYMKAAENKDTAAEKTVNFAQATKNYGAWARYYLNYKDAQDKSGYLNNNKFPEYVDTDMSKVTSSDNYYKYAPVWWYFSTDGTSSGSDYSTTLKTLTASNNYHTPYGVTKSNDVGSFSLVLESDLRVRVYNSVAGDDETGKYCRETHLTFGAQGINDEKLDVFRKVVTGSATTYKYYSYVTVKPENFDDTFELVYYATPDLIKADSNYDNSDVNGRSYAQVSVNSCCKDVNSSAAKNAKLDATGSYLGGGFLNTVRALYVYGATAKAYKASKGE